EAVAAYRNALTVRTRDDMPVQWAMTRENMAHAVIAAIAVSELEPERAIAHLQEVEAALLDALSVYTPEHMPYHYQKAVDVLERVRAKLADI
ncbi:MAG: hypothetical protein CMN73_10370, partial [Sphingomonas sp.]|nr:hypothetical protein [Sphingomonas sp.]